MADTAKPEKLRSDREFLEAAPKIEKPKVQSEVSEKKALDVIQDVEGVESQAGVEFVEGKVGEVAGEDKAHFPAGGSPKTYSADEIEAIRAKLLAALPPQEVMIKQIRHTLNRREKILTKRMKKLQKRSHLHAFELNIVVAQLRKVREYFSVLAHATYELIKHLWLKIVHGV